MTATVLVSVINHYHINGLDLLLDTLYIANSSDFRENSIC